MTRRGEILTWTIPKDKMSNWKRLNPDYPKSKATDCVINSLHYLGIIDNRDFANVLSDYANKKAPTADEVLQLIFNSFESNGFKVYDTIGIKQYTEIRKELKNNEYTIFLYTRRNNTGHAVVLGKIKNELYFIDTQQEEYFCESTNLHTWLKNEDIVKTEFILKGKHARKRNSTTIKLRKTKSPNERVTKKHRVSFSKDKMDISNTPTPKNTLESKDKMDISNTPTL